MTMQDVVALLDTMHAAMKQAGMVSGDIMHVVLQLREAVNLQLSDFSATVNEKVAFQVQKIQTNGELVVETWFRHVDVIARKAGEMTQHIEVKTGELERALPSVEAGIREGGASLQLLKDLALGTSGEVKNIWKIYSTSIEESKPFIEQRMKEWTKHLQENFKGSEQDIKKAVGNFRFEDAFGEAIEFTWSPAGPIAKRAEKAAKNSPDFGPAMDALFGPSGKIADAAHDAATGVNLDPAGKTLEKKLGDGVSAALSGAGDRAAAEAGKTLSQKISAGATELSNILTSVSDMGESVIKLGEAWDKPNKSTKDYMDLLSAAGGTITKGIQVVQAFSAATQLASVAQGIFNAVMAMNPIVLVVIAVVALIAAIALLIIYWDVVSAALRDNPWLAAAAAMLGIIGVIILIIAYWDEVKLAVLIAANFVSIQVQTIGQVFAALGALTGMVWAWIVATAQNAGIGIINTFIAAGTTIQNFFTGLINAILSMYNQLADSAAGKVAGMTRANLIPQADVQARLIPPKDVPQISVAAAFTPKPVKGGLEGQIAAQETAVAKARKADEERRAKAAAPSPPPAPPGAPPTAVSPATSGVAKGTTPLGAPPVPGLPLTGPAGPPAPQAGPPPSAGVPGPSGMRPPLPTSAMSAGSAAAGTDQSVHVEGGITVNINAERLEADAARLLSDELIQRIQERLSSLRSEQDFRSGTRAPAGT